MNKPEERKTWKYQDGRFYFTTGAERKVLFILTIAMLVAGVMVKF